MSRPSRRWLIRLFVIASLLAILCLVLIGYLNNANLTPDNAFALMKELVNRHASDGEVVARFGDTQQLQGQSHVISWTAVDYARSWKFHHESFDKYDTLEISFFFDHQGNCITSVSSRDILEGRRLWQFRWQRLLKSIGW